MASTYSNLKIQLMATGENSGTWGNVTNDNLGIALEEAIVGSADVTFASANVTLTLTDTNASQTARNLRLNLVGTTGGARDLIVPAIEKVYIVNNGCADTVTVKVTGQTGIAVPAGRSYLLYNNGTDVVNALEGISVASGGTGLETLTAESVVVGNGTNAVKFVAPGTSSNVLTSNGTAWVSQAAATTTNANAITTGILSAGVGGTGANTLTSENVIIGNGTSAVKFVAPGTTGNVLTSNGTAWLSQAAGAAGGNYVMQVYTSPATWTKPATVKAVKVTVVGGGGGSGNSAAGGGGGGPGGGGGGGGLAQGYVAAPSMPGPVTVTVGAGGAAITSGGTSSFGPFLSATGGGAGVSSPNPGTIGTGGAGGAGSGPAALFTIPGGAGGTSVSACGGNLSGAGGATNMANGVPFQPANISLSFGGVGMFGSGSNGVGPSTPGTAAPASSYGTGASGAGSFPPGSPRGGAAGRVGIIFVEEFY